jgi:hypothetical protein
MGANIPTHTDLIWWLAVALCNRYRLTAFVETGTSRGHTALLASTHFRIVHTIEVSKTRFDCALPELKAAGNVRRWLGESPKILPEIIKLLSGPALFFLDGHWSGGPKVTERECLLVEELEIVLPRVEEEPDDCILIDNAGMFLKPPHPPHNPAEWPSAGEILEVVRGTCPRKSVCIIGDTIAITSRPIIETLA